MATLGTLHELHLLLFSHRHLTRKEYGMFVRKCLTVWCLSGPLYALWNVAEEVLLNVTFPLLNSKQKSPASISSSTLNDQIRNLHEHTYISSATIFFLSQKCITRLVWFGWLMVLNATFNNISVILWRSVLLVEETGGPRENHLPAACHWQTLSDNVVHLALNGMQTHNISDHRHLLHM